ncbi:MAG: biotin/lipoyl-containing protein, partial [Beijerinckiaceae bacterium]
DKLPFSQEDLKIDGHAVEARVYAEDPENGFLPSTGKLWALKLPDFDGIRVDSGVVEDGEVSPFYDPMIAKVIAHAPTREEALSKLASALGRTIVAGPKSNVAFLKALCEAKEFRAGAFDTGFIDRNLDALLQREADVEPKLAALGALRLLRRQAEAVDEAAQQRASSNRTSPWRGFVPFQLCGPRRDTLKLVVDGELRKVRAVYDRTSLVKIVDDHGSALAIHGDDAGDPSARLNAEIFDTSASEPLTSIVVYACRQTIVSFFDPFSVDIEEADGDAVVKSPMHGKLIALLVDKDQQVERGQRVAIVEAMKMEHVLTAPRDGVVTEIGAQAGQQVAQGAKIVVVHGE